MTSNLFSNFLKFARTNNTNKLHIIYVGALSAGFRFATLYLPFKWVSKHLGAHKGKQEFCLPVNKAKELRAWKTGNFIEKICEKMPWEAKCLVRACILKIYLDKYKIPYIIHIGMTKDSDNPDQPYLAHAWVNVGKYTVSGGDGPEPPKDFIIISTFVARSIADEIK